MRSDDVTRAMYATLRGLDRAGVVPSHRVMLGAGEILQGDRLSSSYPALEYRVPSSDDPEHLYSAFLIFNGRGYVVLKRCTCTCEAGRAEKMCRHLLAALADAHHLGYELEKPKK